MESYTHDKLGLILCKTAFLTLLLGGCTADDSADDAADDTETGDGDGDPTAGAGSGLYESGSGNS
jgi:hypothetical protein